MIAVSPDSMELRERLLELCLTDDSLASHPSRIASILWFIREQPHHFFCRSPYIFIDPVRHPTEFNRVRDAWLEQVERSGSDTVILRGAAAFIAAAAKPEARELLERAARAAPNAPDVQIDLGRLADDPSEQLQFFSRALDLGSTHQNLPVWRAVAALESRSPEARADACELIDLAREDEERLGPATEWMETGHALWLRAREASKDDKEARAKTHAIARRSYYRHWGHTILGVLALEAGDIETALAQLTLSREIQHDFRLDAYGPAPHLVRALCRAGRLEPAGEFLRAWLAYSENAIARQWLGLVERGEIPAEGERRA